MSVSIFSWCSSEPQTCSQSPKHSVVDDPVVDAVSVPSLGEDSRAGEDVQVLRDVLLPGADLIGELVDRLLAVTKLVEEPDAGRLADHAEPPRDQLDQLFGQWMRERHRSAILLYNDLFV